VLDVSGGVGWGWGAKGVDITVQRDAEGDERVESAEDDVRLHQPVVVQLSEVLDEADSTLVVLGVIDLDR